MRKILIIAGGLQVGGAEKVCANISRYSPKEEFTYHYLVFEGFDNAYGKEIERRGGTVITIPSPSSNIINYFHTLKSLIKSNNYDVVHSHTMFNSGINMLIAKQCNVKTRITHSHTTKPENRINTIRGIYYAVSRKLILRYSTHYVACGEEAGKWLFGENAFRNNGIIVHNGIDTSELRFNSRKYLFERTELSLSNRFVIGHVGSLFSVKNQKFLIELMHDIIKSKPNSLLLLVGDGDDRTMLQELSNNNNVSNFVRFVGETSDVVKYLNAFDVFAFPSLREGTPLALIEAQANGLPCIISENIPKDAYLTDLIIPISLNDREKWIESLCGSRRNNSQQYAEIVAEKGYDAKKSYEIIYNIYRG